MSKKPSKLPKPRKYQSKWSQTGSLPSNSPPLEPSLRPKPQTVTAPPYTAHQWRYARWGFAGVSIFAAATPLIGILFYNNYKRNVAYSHSLNVPLDVTDRYDQNSAVEFDKSLDSLEFWTGIARRRKQLLSNAKGHVLESSVGTGRNAKYYPLQGGIVKSVTMADCSNEMLKIARQKWSLEKSSASVDAVFLNQSCANSVPRPKESPSGYDTVVQTMGVCSQPDPVAVLKNLGMMLKPDDPRGRILLLEHGRGKYEWINGILDNLAPGHADRYGCWFNKDIGDLVRRSGLEVLEEKRYQFGTVWWFVLKPPKGWSREILKEGEGTRKEEENVRIVKEIPKADKTSWWSRTSWK